MTPAKVIARLRRLAEDWRREEARLCEQFGDVIAPQSMRARQIKDTQAIDAAIEMIERLEAAESECLEQARLNGMGSEREAALMAKLEAAEKSDAESIAMYRKARDERDALRTALTDLLNDLEERATLNIEKIPRVVACGNSVYVQAKAALEAAP